MKVALEKRVGINRAEETRAEIRRRLSPFLFSAAPSSSQVGRKESGGKKTEGKAHAFFRFFAVAVRKLGGEEGGGEGGRQTGRK